MSTFWLSLVESQHSASLAIWGIAATLSPQGLSPEPFSITGIIKNPSLAEDMLPGSPSGVSVVRFWVDWNALILIYTPVRGDTVAISGVNYDVFDIDVDIEGGAVLKLRRNL